MDLEAACRIHRQCQPGRSAMAVVYKLAQVCDPARCSKLQDVHAFRSGLTLLESKAGLLL